MIDIKNLNLPSICGVYLFKNNKNQYIYIGKSINIKARIKSHWENSFLDKKEALIFQESDQLEIKETENEFQALILESLLIKKYQPKYNVIWKDNKNYLYININLNEEYPKILLSRKPILEKNNKKNYFFGPFSNTKIVKSIIKDIRYIVPFCTEKKITKKPCFYSKIGLCSPCPNYINSLGNNLLKKQLTKKYRSNIVKVIKILSGKSQEILKLLNKELKSLIKKEDFEKAIEIRNKIFRFERLLYYPTSNQDLLENNFLLKDVNNKKINELFNFLKEYYPDLKKIHRIECYDISNLGINNQVGSMVVMTDGLLDKKQYKKFKIKQLSLKSDFERINEVLTRRFKNDWERPDILLIDGGKPQIKIAEKILNQLNLKIPLIGIAKNPDRLIIGKKYKVIIIKNPSSFFSLLINLRDEAHRFAKKYHLYLRRKEILL